MLDKEFRKIVLQIFYKRSNGNSVESIDDFRVGRELGLDYGSSKLEGAISYLVDKGFLNNLRSSIHSMTSAGIDEVENNFPNLTIKNNNTPLGGHINVSNSNVHFGQGNNVLEGESKKDDDIPLWLNYLATIISIIGVIWGMYVYFSPNETISSINTVPSKESIDSATTTVNLLDIFSKAFSYETIAERQDFLGKYVGKQVYSYGVIEEVSRAGDKFLVDINLGKASIVCPQGKTNILEEQYPFLKGKRVIFYGIFTYQTIFGHGDNIISIDPCSFERK